MGCSKSMTRARTVLREHKARTGESLSSTAFLSVCLAKAVEEHKAVQAFRKGSKHLILFGEVDVHTQIERDVEGLVPLMPTIIRAANRKAVREIHQEIRDAQGQDLTHVLKWLQFLPTWLFASFLAASIAGMDQIQQCWTRWLVMWQRWRARVRVDFGIPGEHANFSSSFDG
jgi:hypothetical protein